MPHSTNPPVEQSGFRPPDGNFNYTENTFFELAVPEHKIRGVFYVWHRPHLGFSAGGVTFWNQNGAEFHNCLYRNWDWSMPFPAEGNVFNYSLANGTSVEMLEPLRSFRLRFKAEDCELDAVWEAIMEPQGFNMHGDRFADVGGAHLEQAGRVQGTLCIDGRDYAVDARTNRDHTWGTRDHDCRIDIGYDNAYFSDEHGFTLCFDNVDPHTQGPDGSRSVTSDTLSYGWHIADGVTSKVVSGQRRAETDEMGLPVRMVAEATDALGRELYYEARVESPLNWAGPYSMYWAGATFTSGAESAWGATISGPMSPNLWRRAQRARWASSGTHRTVE